MRETTVVFEDKTYITFGADIQLSCLESGFKYYGNHSILGNMLYDSTNYSHSQTNSSEIMATLNSTSNKVFGIWLRNDTNYCNWSEKIQSIIAGTPSQKSIILILGNYITRPSTVDGSSCDTGTACSGSPTFEALMVSAFKDIKMLNTRGFLKEIWLNINGYAAYYECFKKSLQTDSLNNYISMRTTFKEFSVPFKISWDLEGPAVGLSNETTSRTINDIGFPGDHYTLNLLVSQFYGLKDISGPNGNVLTLGGNQTFWYGHNNDPLGYNTISGFTNILNNQSNYPMNKITDLVPMLYANDNLPVKDSSNILTQWRTTMNTLKIVPNYYYSALVNDDNTCNTLFKPILDQAKAGILVWDGGISKNLTSVVKSYFNDTSLIACPIYSRIYVKKGTEWIYNIFWKILPDYVNLSTLLGRYWISGTSEHNLNAWTAPVFAKLPNLPPLNNIMGIPPGKNAINDAHAFQINNTIVSYAKTEDIIATNKSNIYFVEGTDLDRFMKVNNITDKNSSSTDPTV